MLDREGQLLRPFTVADGRWRLPVSLDAVDPQFIQMLLAFEDRRFFDHGGVDFWALGRAFFQLISQGRIVSGGSTLSMQVVRLLDGRSTRTPWGKLRQIALALALERRASKQEILQAYLHLAPYGGNLEGIRAAALAWFGKPPKRLTPAQAALLVALPQSPAARRPDRHPEAAKRARNRVLQRAWAQGLLDADRLAAARREALPDRRRPFPQLALQLSQRLHRIYPHRAQHRLTLKKDLQQRLEALAKEWAYAQGEQVSAAILVADLRNGEILASVGSAGLFQAQQRGGFLDMTRAVRSPGSTLKPLIYGLAFEQGLAHPESRIEDQPTGFGAYAPGNFDHRYQGTLSIRQALQASRNVPAVKLLHRLGPAALLLRLRRAGAQPKLSQPSPPGLAIGLGGIGLRLWDLVQMYGALGRGGRSFWLHETFDAVPPATNQRVLSERAAWYVTSILSGAETTGPIPPDAIAFKTGTSYGYRDAWCIGFDGRSVVGVWLGRPDGGSVPGLTGSEAAAPLLQAVFQRLDHRAPLPEPPPGVLLVDRAHLPAPLRRVEDGEIRREGPQIAFPPTGANLVFRKGEALVLRVRNGVPPFTWFANGQPIARVLYGQTAVWHPNSAGFATIAVIDGKGASNHVQVFLEPDSG